jgi:hypothetical protein
MEIQFGELLHDNEDKCTQAAVIEPLLDEPSDSTVGPSTQGMMSTMCKLQMMYTIYKERGLVQCRIQGRYAKQLQESTYGREIVYILNKPFSSDRDCRSVPPELYSQWPFHWVVPREYFSENSCFDRSNPLATYIPYVLAHM